ncbi:hypothetical protein Syun_012526 [Stephania yunnanensis]|uniref:Uncharacterized protein n=1 Tax=Stephania yunnanensis TaxID=152371 RepID=A0AAP0PJJ9_9MAGN
MYNVYARASCHDVLLPVHPYVQPKLMPELLPVQGSFMPALLELLPAHIHFGLQARIGSVITILSLMEMLVEAATVEADTTAETRQNLWWQGTVKAALVAAGDGEGSVGGGRDGRGKVEEATVAAGMVYGRWREGRRQGRWSPERRQSLAQGTVDAGRWRRGRWSQGRSR